MISCFAGFPAGLSPSFQDDCISIDELSGTIKMLKSLSEDQIHHVPAFSMKRGA
jgi:hypothetical protein